MPFPNFIIGGAPKCGTTSLFDWLAAHPDVCGSKSKEPFFLVDEGNPLRRKYLNIHDHGLEAYAKVFPRAAGDCKVRMEASTHYLYQQTALEVLSSLPGEPRVLFLLRKPSERVLSSFLFYKMKGNIRRDIGFADFVGLILKDDNSDAVSGAARGTSAYLLPRDIQYSQYVDYLGAWRGRLGDERLRVMLFESVRADPKAAVQAVCDWLGIDPALYENFDFEARNQTSSLRSPAVQRVAQVLASPIRSGPAKEAMKRLYYSLQSTGRRESRSAEDESAMAELDKHFRPFNERLSREFGLDLKAWS